MKERRISLAKLKENKGFLKSREIFMNTKNHNKKIRKKVNRNKIPTPMHRKTIEIKHQVSQNYHKKSATGIIIVVFVFRSAHNLLVTQSSKHESDV